MMRVTANQFAVGLTFLMAQILPAQIVWFLIVAFIFAGTANRDWRIDTSFDKEDLIAFVLSLRNGLPLGWPWGKRNDDDAEWGEVVNTMTKEQKLE